MKAYFNLPVDMPATLYKMGDSTVTEIKLKPYDRHRRVVIL